MALTVTAAQGGSTSLGTALSVAVLTGTAVSQPGATVTQASSTPSAAITATASGSVACGAALGLAGTASALASTDTFQDHRTADLEYLQFRSVATVSPPTPVTLGYTGITGIEIVLAEILAAGTITQDGSTPAGAFANATAVTSASFTPPAAATLVAMVSSNGGGSVTSMTVSDSSGLTWTEQVKANGAGNGYAGVWTARTAGATEHDAAAALSGTGSLTAGAFKAAPAAAAMSGTGAIAAGMVKLAPAAAALSGSGALTAAMVKLAPAAASLSGSGSLAAAAFKVIPAAAPLSGLGTLAASAARHPAPRVILVSLGRTRIPWTLGRARND
jgi:hypothetical protein